jgi:hypothetical protein
MKKFIQRGWTVNAGDPQDVVPGIRAELKNIGVLEEQLIQLWTVASSHY